MSIKKKLILLGFVVLIIAILIVSVVATIAKKVALPVALIIAVSLIILWNKYFKKKLLQ